eukprot:gene3999-2854_t
MASSRVQELQDKNKKLTERLALICKENSNLTSEVVSLQNKVTELTRAPFQKDSVLSQMYDAEKAAGWFKNSKSAKDQLQKLCDGLQKEYVEYKTTHTRSDDEVDSLMKQLKNAQAKSAELADMLQDQRSQTSGGGDTKALQTQLQEKKDEVARLQRELQIARSRNGGSDGSETLQNELRTAQVEIATLKRELDTVRAALSTEEGLHKMKASESDELARRIEVMRTQHREEIASLKSKDGLGKSAKECAQCSRYAKEVEDLRARANASLEELNRVRDHYTEMASGNEKKYAALEAKLMETQSQLEDRTLDLERSVPLDQFEQVEMEKKSLAHENSLFRDRIAHLEAVKRGGESGKASLDDDEILAALARNKERISTLEFEKEELTAYIKKMEAKVMEAESRKNETQRATGEDKQRVAFLLKKCANLGADMRKLQAERDHLSEALVLSQAEAQRLQHQTEEIPALQKKIETINNERRLLEERLSASAEIEEHLVKAKETIAYMELAQTRSISLTQYAELQSQKQKLEHTLGPLQKQLEETQLELERLKEEKNSRNSKETEETITVEDLREEIEGLKENETILKEKVTRYKEENQRLTTLNSALDRQMMEMQAGIKEMALHQEKERTLAREAAEKAAEKEVVRLREELERAQSTIAGIQATEGQFVQEGLYLSAVEEKQQLLDEVQRKTLELEKMKSEILIYRQTIAELETENDEHVKDIEDLQQQLEELRMADEQRQVEGEKKLVDVHEELITLRDAVKQHEETIANNEALIEDLKAKNAKQQRAYEQKCQAEVQLTEQLTALKTGKGAATSAAIAAADGAAADGPGGATPPAAGGTKKKGKKIKKKKTLSEQLSDDGEEDVLRASATPVPAALPAVFPVNPEAERFTDNNSELERLQAENVNLKKMIEKLTQEVEQLQGHNEVAAGSAEENELTRLRKELREAITTTEKLKQQRDQAKAECKRTKTLSTPGGPSEKEKVLEDELRSLRAELQTVAEQLLPTKEKLLEYMAMADRIGIPYPFSDEYERRLARKMRSIKKHQESIL